MSKIERLLERLAADETLPALARELFGLHAEESTRLQDQLKEVEAKPMAWQSSAACSRRLAQIPGVGPIGASMLTMQTPPPEACRSARPFAAWLGLTPKDHATAGQVRLGVITRAGDAALRSVLVAGATAVIRQVRCGRGAVSPWRVNRLKRKPPKLAAVALANKIARLAWKLMVTGESYAAKSASATRASAAWRSARHGERLTCNRAGLVPELAR
jgi:transposase